MDNDYCVIFVKGQKPIYDHKYVTFEKAEYKHSMQLGNYLHSVEKNKDESTIRLATQREIQKWKEDMITISLAESFVSEADYENIDYLIDEDFSSSIMSDVEEIDITDMTVEEILSIDSFDFPDDEFNEIVEGMEHGLTDEEIKSYILMSDPGQMSRHRKLIQALKGREMSGIVKYSQNAQGGEE